MNHKLKSLLAARWRRHCLYHNTSDFILFGLLSYLSPISTGPLTVSSTSIQSSLLDLWRQFSAVQSKCRDQSQAPCIVLRWRSAGTRGLASDCLPHHVYDEFTSCEGEETSGFLLGLNCMLNMLVGNLYLWQWWLTTNSLQLTWTSLYDLDLHLQNLDQHLLYLAASFLSRILILLYQAMMDEDGGNSKQLIGVVFSWVWNGKMLDISFIKTFDAQVQKNK